MKIKVDYKVCGFKYKKRKKTWKTSWTAFRTRIILNPHESNIPRNNKKVVVMRPRSKLNKPIKIIPTSWKILQSLFSQQRLIGNVILQLSLLNWIVFTVGCVKITHALNCFSGKVI
jgi:hypothetical protein